MGQSRLCVCFVWCMACLSMVYVPLVCLVCVSICGLWRVVCTSHLKEKLVFSRSHKMPCTGILRGTHLRVAVRMSGSLLIRRTNVPVSQPPGAVTSWQLLSGSEDWSVLPCHLWSPHCEPAMVGVPSPQVTQQRPWGFCSKALW
jgi:hypothetical protein